MQAAPLVAGLHRRAEQIRVSELDAARRQARSSRRRLARHGGAPHPGARREAPARTVRASARASRLAARRAQCRGGCRPVRPGLIRPVKTIRIATRGSAQALAQSTAIARALEASGRVTELVRIETTGDRTQAANVPLHSIGGQGVFVKEVQRAVLDGRADIAVHSAKDLPTAAADGLVIAAFAERRTSSDALVGRTLAELELGATVATGSVRRRAQFEPGSPRPRVRRAARQHPQSPRQGATGGLRRGRRRCARDPRAHRADRTSARPGRVRPGGRAGLRRGRVPHAVPVT